MFDSSFITNPYKTYTHLRTAAPLHWMDKFRKGAWLVCRYNDVLAGLHNARLSSQRSHTLTAALPTEVQSEFSTFNYIFSKRMLFLDPPKILDDAPVWRPNLSFRGLSRLPIDFRAA